MIRYLRGSIDIALTLEASKVNIIKWWVDASAFVVHPDMRSHTGAVVSIRKGAIYASSTRQKINTRSLTEAELVGVNDAMPQIVWTRNFLQAQGYNLGPSDINQDNQSAMLLEKNCKASSGRRTRHINIRYFFVTDRVAKGEMVIKYCPTKEMLADFLTKALQGTPFRQFRGTIMNSDPATQKDADRRSVLEHVTGATMSKNFSPEKILAHVTQSELDDPCPCMNDSHGHGNEWTMVQSKQDKRHMTRDRREDISRTVKGYIRDTSK